jgi:hypothetical protein
MKLLGAPARREIQPAASAAPQWRISLVGKPLLNLSALGGLKQRATGVMA